MNKFSDPIYDEINARIARRNRQMKLVNITGTVVITILLVILFHINF